MADMLLCARIGNSHTTLGLVRDGAVEAVWRVSTEQRRTADEWQVLVLGLLGDRVEDIDGIAVCATVPAVLHEWQTDSLAAPKTTNAQIQGDDISSFDAVTPTVRLNNYTQISRKTLVIWRKLTGNPEEDNLALDDWFTKEGYLARDSEFDLIYVNGGNNLENLKTPDDLWKVRLIEEDFQRLMFEGEGV